MKKMTLKNDFHKTIVTILTNSASQQDAWLEINAAVFNTCHPSSKAKQKLRRVRNALCGNENCKCGVVC